MIFRHVCKTVKTDYLFVCPSVHMEQLGSHWTDFCEILCLRIFQKSVTKIQVSLKPEITMGTLHEDKCNFTKIYWWILCRM